MKLIKQIKRFSAFFLGTICLLSAFSQVSEDVSEVFRKIDEAVVLKKPEKIAEVLKNNRSSPDYPIIENYTLKKTRQLIITNNLDMARQTSLAVIDNNIENFDAVELYSYIDKAILNQRASDQAAENRRRLEQERIAALNEKSKQQLENRGNYHKVSTASGKEVYLNDQSSSFSSKEWTVKLALADFAYQKITDPAYSSLKYGLGFGANIFYPTERLVIGADVFGDAHIVSFSTEGGTAVESNSNTNEKKDPPQEFFISGRFVPEIAFSDFSKNIFLRAGVSASMLASNEQERTGSMKSFFSPVVGIAFDNLKFNDFQFRMFYDYDLGYLFYEELSSAMEFGGSFLIPMAVNDKTKFGIEFGVQDLLFMKKEGGVENRAKFTFAIGVGNVTK